MINKVFKLLLLLIVFIPSFVSALSTSVDYPVGTPDGIGYSNGSKPGGNDGWGFLEWNGNEWHPGQDFNRGSGHADYGDPIYSISNGKVLDAKNFQGFWGKLILIEHILPDGSKIWSQYAHLKTIDVLVGQEVIKGQQIGTMGDAGGKWASHLHFEIRKKYRSVDAWTRGWTKEKIQEYYYNPSEFIDSHRQIVSPPTAVAASIESKNHDSVKISWTKNTSPHFNSYKVYKMISENDENPNLLKEIFVEDEIYYQDSGLKQDTEYFYKIDVCNIANQCASSNIISTKTDKDSNYIGKIVFSSKLGNYFQIHLMDGVKENIKQLRQSKSNDYNSKWSPNGKKVLFDSTDETTNTRQVFVMDADGSNQKKLTSLKYFANQADWFPDGSKIVFRGNGSDGIGIYTQNLDGTDLKMITPKDIPDSPFSLNSYNPAVLEDGDAIIFEGTYRYGAQRGKGGLFAISIDGKVLIQLTNTLEGSPDVSSKGEIVFSSNKEESNNLFWSIYYSNNKLKDIYKVSSSAPSTAEDPSFSNDGQKIIYSFKNNAKTSDDFELVVVDKDSGEKTTLTDNNVDDIDADIWVE